MQKITAHDTADKLLLLLIFLINYFST